ncbi:uncharacterized protein H6S33_000030 [Morchella sextelata]|uniref:uncharacterized protein n=1 Tax=Morchella sextelata TaxID=1174677 RepID=UPI001D03B1DD|nr:uncharacterized protein H6S33_000030 [Morchella sextelata]KAH0614394.1 hypothetical protein H6S33_000030 [Morchella sextelata]
MRATEASVALSNGGCGNYGKSNTGPFSIVTIKESRDRMVEKAVNGTATSTKAQFRPTTAILSLWP